MTKIAKLASAAVLMLTGIASPVFAQAVQSRSAAHNSISTKTPVARTGARRIRVRRGTRVYDGTWSVVIETTRGNCPAAVRAAVRIIEGRLQADDQSYQVAGRVVPGGVIRVTVSASGQGASGFGRLSRQGGRGRWRTRSGECSGLWTAERRSS